MKKKYLETGKIVGTHGLHGEVRVQPWSDTPQFLCGFEKLYLEEGRAMLDILESRVHKNIVLMKLKGVETIAAAESYRNKVLYLDRADVKLPDGSYFQTDLIGCAVFDADTGEPLGEITDVSKTGANDVWHITKDGKEYLIPSIPDVVVTVDIDGGVVKIRPISGLFGEEIDEN